MDEPIEKYWQMRLAHVKKALEGNNFEVFLAENVDEARRIVLEEILPKIEVKKISRADSSEDRGEEDFPSRFADLRGDRTP